MSHLTHNRLFWRDESFQAIDFTGTVNQMVTKRKYTKHKITNPNTNKVGHSKNTKHPQNLTLKQFISKNCSACI